MALLRDAELAAASDHASLTIDFDTAAAFLARVLRAGCDRARVLLLPGWQTGIVHTVVARRPAGDQGGPT
jgi:hypothetical protein